MGGDGWQRVEPLVAEFRRGCDAGFSRCGIFWVFLGGLRAD